MARGLLSSLIVATKRVSFFTYIMYIPDPSWVSRRSAPPVFLYSFLQLTDPPLYFAHPPSEFFLLSLNSYVTQEMDNKGLSLMSTTCKVIKNDGSNECIHLCLEVCVIETTIQAIHY